jgi:hypothetical protein
LGTYFGENLIDIRGGADVDPLVLTDVMYFSDMRYCEVIINHGVLIFADFVVDLNHENKNPTKYYFPIDCCL